MNEAKAVYISEYYLACRFLIMTLRLRLKSRVTSLNINCHRGINPDLTSRKPRCVLNERDCIISPIPIFLSVKRGGSKVSEEFAPVEFGSCLVYCSSYRGKALE